MLGLVLAKKLMVTKLPDDVIAMQTQSCSSEKIDGNKTFNMTIHKYIRSCSSEKIDGNKTCRIIQSYIFWSCSSEKIDGNKTSKSV